MSEEKKKKAEKPAPKPAPAAAASGDPAVPDGERVVEILSEEEAQKRIRQMSRRSFVMGGIATAAAIGGWALFVRHPESEEISPALRGGLRFNETVNRAYYSPSRLSPSFPKSYATEPVVTDNGDVEDGSDMKEWGLEVHGGKRIADKLDDDGVVLLSLDDIKSFPKVDMIVEHKCIEGWSRVVHWAGARFSDFARVYGPAKVPGYVGLMTPNEDYYVGLERAAAMHPQTLLCYEMNGAPLTRDHGAPLRLAIPIKYGIKNIKCIGSVTFTDKRPADYWAEQGYDWYAGL